MVLYLIGQDDEGKFNYEIHYIKIQQEQKPYPIYVYVDKKNNKKWINIGGRDEDDIHPMNYFKKASYDFVKWLLQEGKDFAVGSHKEYLPKKRSWVLKNFNKNEILDNTSQFLKFQNIINGLAPSGNSWHSDDLGQLQIRGTLLRHKDNDESTDEDELYNSTFIFGQSENKKWYIKHLGQPENTYKRQNIRRVSSKLPWKHYRILWIRIEI